MFVATLARELVLLATEISSLPNATSAERAEVHLALASHTVGSLFEDWAARDAADLNGALAELVATLVGTRYEQASVSYASWPEWQARLPGREAEDALSVVREARHRATQMRHAAAVTRGDLVRSAQEYMRSQLPDWSLVGATMGIDGYWRRGAGRTHSETRAGRSHVVFGHGYGKVLNLFNGTELLGTDVMVEGAWIPRGADDSDGNGGGADDGRAGPSAAAIAAFAARHVRELQHLQALGSNLVTCHFSPEHTLLPPPAFGLNMSAGALQKCLAMLQLASHQRTGAMRVVVLVANELPEWAYALHADLRAEYSQSGREHATTASFQQHSVSYDIDHPAATEYMGRALTSAASLFGCHEALDSWILANEPNFYSTPSEHAMRAYAAFLQRKYAGCLPCLGRAWYGRDQYWQDWLTPARRHANAPPPPEETQTLDSMDGTASRIWLDWARFNARRVSRWARALRAAVRRAAPCHACLMKFNTAPAFPASIVTNGIDRLTMLREMDISGFDAAFPPPWVDGKGLSRGIRDSHRLEYYDNRKYSTEYAADATRACTPMCARARAHTHTHCSHCTRTRTRTRNLVSDSLVHRST